MSKDQRNEDAFADALRESDDLADVMEKAGMTMPSIEEINQGLGTISKGMEDGKGKREWADDDDELEGLLNEEKTPVQMSKEFEPPKSQRPPEVDVSSPNPDEADYAESFASQRETSQLREELEMMSEEMRDLKATIAGVIKEREALPQHLTSIREDINRQMTLMLEKLHFSTENQAESVNVHAISAALNTVKEESTERLAAAADYATDRPRVNSPLANPGSDLKGKRRFRPVK